MSPVEILLLVLLIAVLALQIVFILKPRGGDGAENFAKLQSALEQAYAQLNERSSRGMREDILASSQGTRQELSANFGQFQQNLAAQLTSMSTLQSTHIEGFGQQFAKLNEANAQQLEAMRKAIME